MSVPARLRRPLAYTIVAAVLVVVALGHSDFGAQRLTLWTLYGLLALSLTYVWGRAGILSLGQGLMFGIGAYVYGVVAINLVGSTGETLSAVVLAMVAAALVAAVLGAFMFYGGLGEIYIAVVTLATSLVVQTLLTSTGDAKYHVGDAQLGGFNGLIGIPPITVGDAALSYQDMCVAAALAGLAVVVLLRWLDRRPFGRVVVAVRENPVRTELLGYDPRRYQLAAFTLGGAIAGLAGAGFAAWGLIVNPEVFGLQLAALVAVWVLLGGRAALLGAFVGTFAIEWMSNELGGTSGDLTTIVIGGVLIAAVLLLPQGVVPALTQLVTTLWRRLRPAPAGRPAPEPPARRTGEAPKPPAWLGREAAAAALSADDLRKQFGGVAAVNGVSLGFPERGVSCLIGPNGAGKSTFFGLLVGRHRPTAGRVLLGERELQRLPPHRRVRQGFGIKLQVPSIYTRLSVRENLWLAANARVRRPSLADERTSELLAWLELEAEAERPAGELSHGHQQRLEIGMVVAGEPAVILLDEPTAGMTRAETEQTAELVLELGRQASVIVVEHDMEFVRRLDAPVTVFHNGAVFASGSIADLREDERVLDIYLGRPLHAGA